MTFNTAAMQSVSIIVTLTLLCCDTERFYFAYSEPSKSIFINFSIMFMYVILFIYET